MIARAERVCSRAIPCRDRCRSDGGAFGRRPRVMPPAYGVPSLRAAGDLLIEGAGRERDQACRPWRIDRVGFGTYGEG